MSDPLLQLESSEAHEESTASARAVRIAAHGEIDSSSAHLLGAEFTRLIEEGAKLVLFEAGQVEFMDSSGLREIVAAGKKLSAVGGRLLIEGMSGAVQRVLEVSGLLDSYRDRPS